MIIPVSSFAENYELIIEDIKKNIDVENYHLKVGEYLYLNKKYVKDIKESLRQASIINFPQRAKLITFSERIGIIDKVESMEWFKQADIYKEIFNKLKLSVNDIDKELSYTTFRCTGVEDTLYAPNKLMHFTRDLRMSDVSAYQDFVKFMDKENITIRHIPSSENIITYVSAKENIRFSLIEKKFIYNNATAMPIYKTVSLNDKEYSMFPYQMYPYDIYPYEKKTLADLTALEYAWFALNLRLVNKLTPETFTNYKKAFKRNASLCLYSR